MSSNTKISKQALLMSVVALGVLSVALWQQPFVNASPAAPITAATPTPPRFSIDLTPLAIDNLPGLHSYVVGQANGRFLLLGGRTNGLHLFVQSSNGGNTPPPNAFPSDKTNRRAWVIDPNAKRVWSASLQGLPTAIADQLAANNAEHYQDGNTLYIIGGYGADSQSQNMITFPGLIAVRVNETINAIVNGQSFNQFVQQTTSYVDCIAAASNVYNDCFGTLGGQCKTGPGWAACQQKAQAQCRAVRSKANSACIGCVQSGNTQQCNINGKSVALPINTGSYAKVTGGGLQKVGNVFYLVFGQDFEGMYSILEGDYGKWPILQNYTKRIIAMQFTPQPLSAALLTVIQQDPNDPMNNYNRRDLNIEPALTSSGEPRIAAYGGVFVPGQDSAYQQPIYIDAATDPTKATVTVDTKYQQMMSQYDCATLTLFDRSSSMPTISGNQINVFFGGIGLYYLDRKTSRLRLDEGLPFVRDLAVMTRYADGSYAEYVRREPLPCFQNYCYVGSDAEFIADPTLPAAANGVIYLDTIKQRTLMGYVFGGIAANQPQAGDATGKNSTASSALYEVWLTPIAPPAGYWIQAVPSSAAKNNRRQ
jgi:hypothetical protein